MAPSTRRWLDEIRVPSTNVPFVLPRSSIVARPDATVMARVPAKRPWR
jgi:hypothetical protein